MTSRKITYHTLKMYKYPRTSGVIYKGFDFEDFIDWFKKLQAKDKIYDISDNKFTSLDHIEKIAHKYITSHKSGYFGMMSTGNYGSRRNLKNSRDNSRRTNPKKIEEGEEQENYFVLGFNSNGDIDLILQNSGRGVKSLHIKNYFDKFFNQYLSAKGLEREFEFIEGAVVSTVDKMIDRLERVTKTKVFVDKVVLKDDLDLSDRTLQARQEIIIDVRAQRGQDIRDFLQEARQKMAYRSKIDKIWIEGKDHLGNSSSFFLDQIQKSTFVRLDMDPSTASLYKENVKQALIKLL